MQSLSNDSPSKVDIDYIFKRGSNALKKLFNFSEYNHDLILNVSGQKNSNLEIIYDLKEKI